MPKLDTIGKLVGLVVSVVFCGWVIFVLTAGRLRDMTPLEFRVFWAFFIILGGPIPYFFTNTVSDTANLSTPIGKFTLGGGYVVCVLAFVLVDQLIEEPSPLPQPAWRKCVLDNDVEDDITNARDILVKNLDGNGRLFVDVVAHERSRVEFYCCFDVGQTSMKVYIGLPSRVKPPRRKLEPVISRDGSGAESISVRLKE